MIAKHPGPCKFHAFQDKTYGTGYRVMNPVYVSGKCVGARCTVCSPDKEKMKKKGGVYALVDLVIRR